VIPEPYNPAHLCPKCGAEGAKTRYHGRPALSFGSEPRWPCADPAPGKPPGEHLCCRCESCGHAWTENVAPGGS
jgi:hypothetical protein